MALCLEVIAQWSSTCNIFLRLRVQVKLLPLEPGRVSVTFGFKYVSTVVKHLNHFLEVEGLSAATIMRHRKVTFSSCVAAIAQ